MVARRMENILYLHNFFLIHGMNYLILQLA